MSRGSDEEISDGQPRVHQDMIGPDGNWVLKRAQQNQAGFNSAASPVDLQKFEGLTGTWAQDPAGDSSEDEEGWRVAERYCIDHRAAYDMEEIY